MKTVFIVISRGILARNLLRTDFFKRLKSEPGVRIVIMFSRVVEDAPLPTYLEKELDGDNVFFEYVPNKKYYKLHSKFNHYTFKNLVFTKTRRLQVIYGTAKLPAYSPLKGKILSAIYRPLSKMKWLKHLVRAIEMTVFRDRDYVEYFEKYQPDVVLAGAILSNTDVVFLKEAKRRGVAAIAMPKSWDNLDKILFKVVPDKFLVQNENMKKLTQRLQLYPDKIIETVGFAQFDMYRDASIRLTREAYCKKHGFDPELPILFLGSEGMWSPGDDKHFELIYQATQDGRLPAANLLIRPHFSLIDCHAYNRFKKYDRVFVDDTYRQSDFFADKWDITEEEMYDFVNSLYHMDMMITYASTLALDAACFDKPILVLGYGLEKRSSQQGEGDLTYLLYQTDFYQDVLKTNALHYIHDDQELFETIHRVLRNPEEKQAERSVLVSNLCYKVDGKVGERMVDEIKNFF